MQNCENCGNTNSERCNACFSNTPSNWIPKEPPNLDFLNLCQECKNKKITIEIQREVIERLYDEIGFYKKILYGGNK